MKFLKQNGYYKTLMKQAGLLASKNELGAMVGVKESSSNTIESEHCQPSTINQCCHEVYGISAYESNAMKSQNPNSGIYKADTTRTLDNNGGNPACNQGGMIVLEGNGSRPSHKGDGYAESDVSYTLNATEHHAVCAISLDEKMGQTYVGEEIGNTLGARDYKQPQAVCYGLDRASFNQGQNAKYNFSVENDLAQTIVAKGPGGTDRTVGALCARDYKGVGNQYVNDGKLVIQNIGEPSGRQQNQNL